MMPATTLLIDDEADVLESLKDSFVRRRLSLDTAITWEEGLSLFQVGLHELVIADYNLRDSKHGLTLLDAARTLHPSTQVVLISGWVDEEAAKEAKQAKLIDEFYPKTSELAGILVQLASEAEARATTNTDWKRSAAARMSHRQRDLKELDRIDRLLRTRLPE